MTGDRCKRSAHRQARVDALPALRTAEDIVRTLSDDADGAYPIFRNMTLTTVVLDGASGDFRVWCCGTKAKDAEPLYEWNLHTFFDYE